MSDETAKKSIQYDEGESTLALMDGTIANRGEPVEVDADLADELLQSSIWYEPGKSEAEGVALAHDDQPESEEEIREAELANLKVTEAAKEKAEEEGVDLTEVEPTGGREGDQVVVDDVKEAAETSSDPAATVPPSSDMGGSGGTKKTRR